MKERNRLSIDGIKECGSEELQSYLGTVRGGLCGHQGHEGLVYRVHIPIQIAKHLRLQLGDLILVAIRKAGELEKEEYDQSSTLARAGKRRAEDGRYARAVIVSNQQEVSE